MRHQTQIHRYRQKVHADGRETNTGFLMLKNNLQ